MGRLSGLLGYGNILNLHIILGYGNIIYRRRNILDLRIVKGPPFHIAHPIRSDRRRIPRRPRRSRYPPILCPVILILLVILLNTYL